MRGLMLGMLERVCRIECYDYSDYEDYYSDHDYSDYDYSDPITLS